MCLILFSWKTHPKYKLIFAANRDEFYSRATARAAFWDDHPQIAGGRDLEGGGTWLGVSAAGKWAAVTNYRDLSNLKTGAPSRGRLTVNYLKGDSDPGTYIDSLASSAAEYNGFNLLVGDKENIYYFSNQTLQSATLNAGIYGLSNHLLDTPWPKVRRGKSALQRATEHEDVDIEELMKLLYDAETAADKDLPDTGVGLEVERALSSAFIRMEGYGSRCSTVILVDYSDRVFFCERSYKEGVRSGADAVFRLQW